MLKIKNILAIVIIILATSNSKAANDSLYESKPSYYYSAQSRTPWDLDYILGISLSHLPSIVVEEEISQSPMIIAGAKVGLPYNLDFAMSFQSNYIANYGLTEIFWNVVDDKFSLSLGAKFAMWFGHLEMDAIHLKSYGGILYPSVKMSYDFDNFIVSTEIETQHSRMATYSEDEFLGTIREPSTGFAIKLTVEQPLWNNNITALSFKANYAKLYYQSWLSFNTIDEYLFYPELLFAFEL